jgi:heptose-I-phosphate ethanolaminephosphotransferase
MPKKPDERANLPLDRKGRGTHRFYLWCVLYALYFPLVVMICDFIAFPRIPDVLDFYLFQELLIGWGVNFLCLLPGLILPVLILPCMLLLYGGIAAPSMIYAGTNVVFGARFDYALSEFVWNANWNQAYEYLRGTLSLPVFIVLLVVMLIPLGMFFCAPAPRPKSTLRRALLLIPPVLIAGYYELYVMNLHQQHHIRTWVEGNVRVHFFKYYVREFYRYRDMYEQEKLALETFVVAPKTHFPLTGLRSRADRSAPIIGVVLVGESASRLNHGIYGYFRDTTPRLSAMSEDLFVFDKAEVTMGASTRSLLGAFSFVDGKHDSYIYYKCSIFDILNNAGFQTYWFTNSVIETIFSFAQGDSFVRLLNSNVQHYEDVNVASEEGKHLDIAVLPFVEKTMETASGDLSIFVRFMGSHTQYFNRYPTSFACFKDHPDDPKRPWLTWEKKSIIDNYDDSIRYSDHVVAELLEAVKRQGGNSFVLYFSDHGEEVFQTEDFAGRLGKEGIAETQAIMKVPLILWLSDDYRRNFPEIVEAARVNLHKEFVLDDLLWMMAELYGLTFDGFRPDRSLVNMGYVPDSPDIR